MVRYEWDEAKRERNLREHGLDFAEAALVYENPEKETLLSPRGAEQRKLDLAIVEIQGAVTVLVYVERGDVIRVISMRKASRKERRFYADLRRQK